MNNQMEKEVFEIYVDDIIPNRFQPRLSFNEKALNELADSIKQHGIIQPLVVRKVGDKYEIIAGERRYKASLIAGLKKIPAIIMNLNDNESAEIAVVENVQRKDLTPIEEARSYKKILDKGYLNQDQLANKLGKTQATISNKLRLLNLDEEVQDALLNGKISERHARSLLGIKDMNIQKQLLNDIIENKLTVKQTDDLIKSMTNPNSNDNQAETLFEEVPNNNEIATNQNKNEEVNMNEEKENIDVDKIKEEAIDINAPVSEKPNLDELLIPEGREKEEKLSNTLPPENDFKMDGNKFVPVMENEINNQTQEENLVPEHLFFNTEEENNNNFQELKPNIPEIKENKDTIISDDSEEKIEKSNLINGINVVRGAIKTLERNGFIVDTEEFDFEDIYQIIIKINK